MALFRSLWSSDPTPAIEGRGVTLRAPRMGDFDQWVRVRGESRAFLTPWEPVWPEDDLTRASFRRRLQRYDQDRQSDYGYSFFVMDRRGALLGGVALTNVRRGVAQTASIGYWMGASAARQGHMSAALAALVPFAHGALRLRRIEAACLPHNAASIRLLEKSHFQREGFARQYLCIAGKWQDHVLFARVADDPMP